MRNKLRENIKNLVEKYYGDYYFKQEGYCPCCDRDVSFISRSDWLRDHFKCSNCNSIPRERALMLTIEKKFPNWRNLQIHESSPGARGHSIKLKKWGKFYLESHFFPDEPLGKFINGFRNEDLENQTFPDEVFDIVVTSDVMEHIYEPEKAFREIHRTLKPGGAHIFSVPLINRFKKTQRWARKGADGEPEFLYQPEWHGNPLSDKGSPVTMHWGYDIVDFIKKYTGAECEIVYYDDLHYGIRAEYREIIVAQKTSDI